ncbi:MAG: beta strand repeat-containing protein [Fusobacteriaceae bacterium]
MKAYLLHLKFFKSIAKRISISIILMLITFSWTFSGEIPKKVGKYQVSGVVYVTLKEEVKMKPPENKMTFLNYDSEDEIRNDLKSIFVDKQEIVKKYRFTVDIKPQEFNETPKKKDIVFSFSDKDLMESIAPKTSKNKNTGSTNFLHIFYKKEVNNINRLVFVNPTYTWKNFDDSYASDNRKFWVIKPFDDVFITLDGKSRFNVREEIIENYTMEENGDTIARYSGTKIIFKGTIRNSNSERPTGIAYNGGSIYNEGNIYVNGSNSNGLLAYTNDGSFSFVQNNKNSNIIGKGESGLRAWGNNAVAQNDGYISVSGAGLIATDFGKVVNNGYISALSQNSIGIYLETSGTAINNGSILASAQDAVGMFLVGTGSATNNGTISATSKGTTGIYMFGNVSVDNSKGTIYSSYSGDAESIEQYSAAVTVTGKDINTQINGNIYVDGSSAVGVIALNGATIKNMSNIQMGRAQYSKAIGMYANNGSTILNDGSISFSGGGTPVGMYVSSLGKAINSGKIYFNGSGSPVAMKIEEGGTGINSENGEIKLTKTSSGQLIGVSLETTGSFDNYGNIYIINTDTSGAGTKMKGIYSKGGKLNNEGTIYGVLNDTTKGELAGLSYTGKDTIINKGKIYLFGYGISSSGEVYGIDLPAATGNGSVENTGDIIIKNSGGRSSFGINTEGSGTQKNSGTIYLTHVGNGTAYGMNSVSSATISNIGAILGSSDGSFYGIRTSGRATNGGDINFSTKIDGFGMKSESRIGGYLENQVSGQIKIEKNGTTSLEGVAGMSAKDEATVLNYGSILLTSNGGKVYGIDVGNSSKVINSKRLKLSLISDAAGSVGIFFGDSVVDNLRNSELTIENKLPTGIAYGIKGSSEGGVSNNEGIITSLGSNQKVILMESGTVINKEWGIIDIHGVGSIGISAKNTAINNGRINVAGNDNIGIYITSDGGNFINDKKGVIYVTGAKGVAMLNTGASEMVNNGTIILDVRGTALSSSQYANGYGMKVTGGGRAINNGTITMSAGTVGAIGMYASGARSRIKNNGEINMNDATGSIAMYADNGGVIESGTGKIYYGTGNYSCSTPGTGGVNCPAGGTGTPVSGILSANNNNGSDYRIDVDLGNGNKLFAYSSGGAFVNYLPIKSETAFNPADFGDGKFVIGEGGSVKAPEISGTIYADRTILKNVYDRQAILKDALIADYYGEIKVETFSPMLIAYGQKNQDGKYDIVIERKKFAEVFENKKLANFYDAILFSSVKDDVPMENLYKLILSAITYEQAVAYSSQAVGINFFPTIQGQTQDVMQFARNSISNNIYYKYVTFQDTKNHNVILGYDFQMLNVDENKYAMRYDNYLNMMNVGYDIKINSTMRTGFVTSLGLSSSTYSDTSSYKSSYIQMNGHFMHRDKPNLYGIFWSPLETYTTPYFGIISGDATRKVNDVLVDKGEFSSGVLTRYFGLYSQVSTEYAFKYGSIIPKLSFDIASISQGEMREEGLYSVKVEEIDSNSIETGIGVDFRKDFTSWGINFLPKLAFKYNYQFGNLTPQMNATFESKYVNPLPFDEYELNSWSVDMNARLDLSKETWKGLNCYLEYVFTAGSEYNNNKFGLGINYLF